MLIVEMNESNEPQRNGGFFTSVAQKEDDVSK